MLQSLRDKVQGGVAIAIASIIAIVFALWGVQNLRTGKGKVVAKVNGKDITMEQVRAAYEQNKHQLVAKVGKNFSLDRETQMKIKHGVLQRLINEQVLLHAATKIGLGVTTKQVWGIIASLPLFRVEGKFSLVLYRRAVSKIFYSEEAFINNLKSMVFYKQLEESLVKSSFILPYEQELLRDDFRQRRDFSYLTIPFQQFTDLSAVDEESIGNYYGAHGDEFTTPEMISLQYLELSSKKLAEGLQVTEEEARHFYDEHSDIFSLPQRWQLIKVIIPPSGKTGDLEFRKKLEDLTAALKSKDHFSSQDDTLKVSTIWITENELASEARAKLKGLKVGDVTQPILDNGVYTIFKILNHRSMKSKSYEQVASEAKVLCKKHQLSQKFAELYNRLNDLVYTNPDDLDQAARELGLALKTTELFTREGGKSEMLVNAKVIKAAFSEAVLRERYNSGLIELAPGEIIVMRVGEYVPEKLKPLDQVRSSIVKKLSHEKSTVAAEKLALAMLDELRDGKSEEKLAAKYKLSWQRITGSSHGAAIVEPNLLKQVFTLAHPKDGKVSATLIKNNDGYVVVHLTKVHYANSYSQEQLEKATRSFLSIHSYYDYQNLLGLWTKRAKIKEIVALGDGVYDAEG